MFDIYDSIFNALNTQVLQPCEFQAGFSAWTGPDVAQISRIKNGFKSYYKRWIFIYLFSLC